MENIPLKENESAMALSEDEGISLYLPKSKDDDDVDYSTLIITVIGACIANNDKEFHGFINRKKDELSEEVQNGGKNRVKKKQN